MVYYIDSHCSHWDLSNTLYSWPTPDLRPIYRSFTTDDIENELKKTQVKYFIHTQITHTHQENMIVSCLAEEYYCIAGYIGWTDLSDPDISKHLFNMKQDEFLVGLRHLALNEPPDWFVRKDILQGFAAMAQRDLPFDAFVKPNSLKHLMHVAYQNPNLKIVLNHCGKPYIRSGLQLDDWMNDIAYLAQYPNVYCKLSGLMTQADLSSWSTSQLQPYVDHIMKYFSADRCMFGSDWPVCLMANVTYNSAIETVETLLNAYSDEEKEKVFSGTVKKIYQLQLRPYGKG